MLTRQIKYQLYVLTHFIYYPIFLVLFFDTSTLFHAFNCSAPAAWIQVLFFGVCFKGVASFYHPRYLLRTSPRSIPCAWNSWIWHFYLNDILLPRRDLWNLVFATLRPESMKLTCQFRRFLARTFRPVKDMYWIRRKEEREQKGGHEYKTKNKPRSARNTTRKTGRGKSIHIRHRLIETGKQTRNGLWGDRGYYW